MPDTCSAPAVLPFDVEPLRAWLSRNVAGFTGPLRVRKFKGGQSNPTYQLETPRQTWVMRCKPGPVAKLLPSAHAIEREFRLASALAGSDVPVARMHALCEDETVIGRAFYIMEFVRGRILWDPALPGMTAAERGAIYDAMNDVIARLHRMDYRARGLQDYGRPDHYIERQIRRWSQQYAASETSPIPAMDRLIAWLPEHLPDSARSGRTSIVHGDFRIDNLIFHPTEPRVLAVLDWELSTLGHPLADFAYHCMTWHIRADLFPGIGGLDLARLGIPCESEYIRSYCERTGLASAAALEPDWNFYMAYNMFRIAAILQGIARRVQDGTASSEQAVASGARARPMAELAWQFARLG